MARAMVIQERQVDASWRPTMVFQATPNRLDYRVLAGDVRREEWARSVRSNATPRRDDDGPKPTWEDWIGWAVSAFSNGHTLWCNEVEPETTVEQTFTREVLGVAPQPLTPPEMRPNDLIPETLAGYKKVTPKP